MSAAWDEHTEWLETDGLGGFSSGTVNGIRARRYHALLIVAVTPPSGRVALVNGVEVLLRMPSGDYPLSSQRYAGPVTYPDGFRLLESFSTEPWPTWRFRLPDGIAIQHELCVLHGSPTVALKWRLLGPAPQAELIVRPLLSGRNFHALHRENNELRFDASSVPGRVHWQTYASMPVVTGHHNGTYDQDPHWYRNFFYQEDLLRGYDAVEDLASPGAFSWRLDQGEAILILTADSARADSESPAAGLAKNIYEVESRRRSAFASPIERAADQYIVRRGSGKTIIAGYPWFQDWGRDSFVSVRGLCTATGRYADASEILLAWAEHISEGMLPNCFPDAKEEPEYNSVDASLWFVIAAQELLETRGGLEAVTGGRRKRLLAAVAEILTAYAKGTRYGIRADADGLLAAGEPGSQITWMDARVNGAPVTPRIGKPVEVQALWLNALWMAGASEPKWRALFAAGRASFRSRFWSTATSGLFDVVDCDHRPGTSDDSFRPNQIFAVGGLPLVLIEPTLARKLVDEVERRLLTPLGLRTLAPGGSAYAAQCAGGPVSRDGSYHQGTVWPWLAGPFIEAWVRVRGDTTEALMQAKNLFLAPLLAHLGSSGLQHVSEIADAEAPYMPRGCPFQAWSMGELLRTTRFLESRPTETGIEPDTVKAPRVHASSRPGRPKVSASASSTSHRPSHES